jgi:hypothetical protein
MKPIAQARPSPVVDTITRRILVRSDAPPEERETLLAIAEQKLRGAAKRLNRAALVRECAAIRGAS